MELIKAENMPESFVIHDMSDLHIGSPNCAIETLQEVIAGIESEKNAYVIMKGDAIECILPGDKRYMHTAVMDEYRTPADQADKVVELFRPLKGKILAWGMGNHEYKLLNTIDFAKYMATKLDAPYGAYTFKLLFSCIRKKIMFKTYHTHGMGGINSHAKDEIQYHANRAAALKHKLVKSGIGDCVYMSRGHDHQLIVVEPTVNNHLYLTDDGHGIKHHYRVQSSQTAQYIPPDSRWYATTGSYRKLYCKSGLGITDYAELAGYAPSAIGHVKVTVEDRQIVDVQKKVA